MTTASSETTADSDVIALFHGHAEIRAFLAARFIDDRDHESSTAAAIKRHSPNSIDVVVDRVVAETPRCRTLRLRRRDGGELPYFMAGQYVGVGVAGTSRPYAISSSPLALEGYDITVAAVPGGRVSGHLLDIACVGDEFVITGPMGTFFHNPLFHGDDVVFLAGGSGVTPAMSMIREIVDRGLDRRFHLVYGARTAEDILFRTELDAIAAAHPGIRVEYVLSEPASDWSGPTGFLSGATIESVVGALGARMCYVCGPTAFQDFAVGQLRALGQPSRRIRVEANGAPPRPEQDPNWPAGVDPDASVRLTAVGRTVETRCGQTLLDALEGEGMRIPAGCRSGECGLCRVRVADGDVVVAAQTKLRMSDGVTNHVHACVAYPLSDSRIEVWPGVC
ncbi:2Fe-2S iron-sulfur cluster-binding protein [Nocardia brasiliensis]|uniref:2Fe-2S iron-sulfur cluster-binding protein n=1 Tax=Nocardia brasiliensis TaxID=37326 RepID=UPI0024561320|nr:2Fe-2S iron-sulfur cluster-binding protein [Nocardia brasiliensis]